MLGEKHPAKVQRCPLEHGRDHVGVFVVEATVVMDGRARRKKSGKKYPKRKTLDVET